MVTKLTDPGYLLQEMMQFGSGDIKKARRQLNAGLAISVVPVWWPYFTTAVKAAAVIIALGMAVWGSFNTPQKQADYAKADKVQGKHFKALLKRSNGDTLNLNELNKDVLKPALRPTKNNGELSSPIDHLIQAPSLDTLQTEKGAFYRYELSDGTIVWLNCASSLQYPDSFSGPERKVYLQGEAYFEIAKNSRPFKVFALGMEVKATGTKFNVKAYKEDGVVRTSLLEGSVKIKRENITVDLSPGEMIILNRDRSLHKIVDDSSAKQSIAWTENKFQWVNEDLSVIVADIARWYDYELVYDKTNLSGLSYSATLSRNAPLNQTLEILQINTGLKFKIIGKRISIYR